MNTSIYTKSALQLWACLCLMSQYRSILFHSYVTAMIWQKGGCLRIQVLLICMSNYIFYSKNLTKILRRSVYVCIYIYILYHFVPEGWTVLSRFCIDDNWKQTLRSIFVELNTQICFAFVRGCEVHCAGFSSEQKLKHTPKDSLLFMFRRYLFLFFFCYSENLRPHEHKLSCRFYCSSYVMPIFVTSCICNWYKTKVMIR